MSARPYQIKGSTLRSKFDFVHEHFGSDARAALEQRFADRDLFPLLHSGWYDYDLFVDVLDAIAETHFDGDVSALAQLGEHSAELALKTVYAAFVQRTGFLEFLRGMSRLHHMFYNRGEIVVDVGADRRSCEIRHRDKPRYADSDLQVARGFYRKAAELHGLSDASCEFTTDDDGASFKMTWVRG